MSVFNEVGFLSPIMRGEDGTSTKRSPYKISIMDVFELFGYTEHRKKLLKNLLEYRKELYKLGIKTGSQWISGSFISDIESLEKREPADIDIVTFYMLPENMTQESLFAQSEIFKHDKAKVLYNVDGYFLQMGIPYNSPEINQVSYWYSIWSHSRQRVWKGFVEVELNEVLDNSSDLNKFICKDLNE